LRLEHSILTALEALPRAKLPDAIGQRIEAAGVEDHVQALVVDGADDVKMTQHGGSTYHDWNKKGTSLSRCERVWYVDSACVGHAHQAQHIEKSRPAYPKVLCPCPDRTRIGRAFWAQPRNDRRPRAQRDRVKI